MINFGAHCRVDAKIDSLLKVDNEVLQQIQKTKNLVIANDHRPEDILTISLSSPHTNGSGKTTDLAEIHLRVKTPLDTLPKNKQTLFNIKRGTIICPTDGPFKEAEDDIQEWVMNKWRNILKAQKANPASKEEKKMLPHQSEIDVFKEDKEAAKIDKQKLNTVLDILS